MLIDVGVFLIYFIASIDPRKLLHWGLVTLWHKHLSNNLNGLVKHKYNFFLKKNDFTHSEILSFFQANVNKFRYLI